MAEPFLAEIRIFSFNFPPKGWAFCNGQLLPINQNQALFSLLGTMYGGNGQTNFALPNLRGRTPLHVGSGHTQGEAAGQTAVTITQQTMPQHLHFLNASTDQANAVLPGGNVFAVSPQQAYTAPANFTPMEPTSVTNVGGNQPHTNMMPYLVLNFCIALQGIFPSRN
jgi:microcystin-dependent protein